MYLSLELLDTLFRMGHGDKIVLADAFPPGIERVERFAFYDRAKRAFAVVMTGKTVWQILLVSR